MSIVVCIVSAASIRKEPSNTSEMTSQILLGEFAIVLETEKYFTKIECVFDGYKGWCANNQLATTNEIISTSSYVADTVETITINNQPCLVSFGTPVFEGSVEFGNYTVDYEGINSISTTNASIEEHSIVAIATTFIQAPYLWGGKSIFGIDCSGFVQQVFKLLHINLPRDAHEQAKRGDVVDFLQSAVCGDVAFFNNEQGQIIHVGILLDSTTIIHAAGCIRIDTIDNEGIVHLETGKRTHTLRIIKRLI